MTYNETVAKKGQNDVTSILFNYLLLEGASANASELILISDGCAGQNKNYVMVKFWYMVVHVLKLYTKVTHIFPVRGHSYLPNDQDFGLIGQERKKVTAEIEEDWDKVILSAKQKPSPFNLVKMTQNQFYNVTASVEPYFLKTPNPAMEIKKAKMIQINSTT